MAVKRSVARARLQAVNDQRRVAAQSTQQNAGQIAGLEQSHLRANIRRTTGTDEG